MTVKKMITYRPVWMGFAMLWIMLYHSDISLLGEYDFIHLSGYAGVDIFLFASGIGNYYSYFKDESPYDFIKRRILRLAPAYLPFILIWCIQKVITNKLPFTNIIGNIFAVQAFSSKGEYFNWYLTGLIICYLLTPYLASFVKKNSNLKNAALVTVFIIISFAFWTDEQLIISFTRIPIYIIGLIFAKHSENIIEKKHIFIGIAAALVGGVLLIAGFLFLRDYLFPYGIYWYPFILITPIMCYFISFISQYLEKNKITNSLLNIIKKIGALSFELYLTHIFIFDIAKEKINIENSGLKILIWIALFILVFSCAILLHKLSEKIAKIISK